MRRSSITIRHTDDNDYHIQQQQQSTSTPTICSEETTLQSGMMLNHCILYREVNFKSFNLKPFGYNKEYNNKVAFIVIRYNHNHLLCDENVIFNQAQIFLNTYFNNSNASNASNSSLNTSQLNYSNEFVWLHIVDKQCLSLLSKHFNLPMIAINAFMDAIPRTTFNIFNDGSVLLTMTSFCCHDDGIICSIKVCCFIRQNIIIVYERRTHASVQDISHSSTPSINSNLHDQLISDSPIQTQSTNSTQHTLTQHKQQFFQTSLRNVLHSIKASHVTESETKEQQSLFIQSHQISNDQQQQQHQQQQYSGRVYLNLKQKLSLITSYQRIQSEGSGYFLYEIIYIMLEMITPVISFYSQRQLLLHDTIYIREEPPTHSEGNQILDHIDCIQSGFQLMENLTERSTLCLIQNKEKMCLIMLDEYVSDIISSYEHALDVIKDMHEELKRITENINDIITRRNEQISIVLSLVATVFLPLTFFAGVFGMNFSDGGILVYMLQVSHGENYFWGSCVICIVVCFYIFISKGWIDMLGKVRRGGQSNVMSSNGKNIVSLMEMKWNKIFQKHSQISNTTTDNH